MMEDVWNMSLETWLAYWGEGWHVLLFALCLAYLLFSKKDRKKGERRIFVGYTLVTLVIFFLPYTANVIANYCIGETVYWRVLWLLPTAPAIAYACTKFCTSWKNAGFQMIFTALLLSVIVLTGEQVYVEGNYHVPDNSEKVAYEIKAIAELVREDAGDGKKKLVAPDSIATYLRIYAPDIKMPYGRGSRGARRKISKQLHLLLNQEPQFVEPAQVTDLASQARCGYLVVWTDLDEQQKEYASNGYSLLGMVDKYCIYKYKKP